MRSASIGKGVGDALGRVPLDREAVTEHEHVGLIAPGRRPGGDVHGQGARRTLDLPHVVGTLVRRPVAGPSVRGRTQVRQKRQAWRR